MATALLAAATVATVASGAVQARSARQASDAARRGAEKRNQALLAAQKETGPPSITGEGAGAAERERERIRRQRGRASTILTGGTGLATSPQNLSAKTLLGS